MKRSAWAVVVLLAELSASWGAEPGALRPVLAPWEVLSGKGEVSQAAGGPMVMRLMEGGELLAGSATFPVQGDTIYRVALQLKRQQGLRVYARIQEMREEQPGPLHALAFWPGYALPPPEFVELGSYLATSQGAVAARVNLVIWPGESRKTGEAALQGLTLTAVGKVEYPPTDSASFLLNGACEAADEEGIARHWQSWGGAAERRRIVPGAGRNGTAALAISGNYLLSSPNLRPHTGRRYRLGAWFRGTGTVSFELRGYHGWEILAMGQSSGRFIASPEEWRWFTMDTVALPGQTQLAPMIAISAPADSPMLVDDASLVEVGAASGTP